MWLKLTVIGTHEDKKWAEWSPSELIIIPLVDVMCFSDEGVTTKIQMKHGIEIIGSDCFIVDETIDEIWAMINAAQT